MLYIDTDHLQDGIYNIKDGMIFKYKARGGTVRTYEMGEIVHCKDCAKVKESGGHANCNGWLTCQYTGKTVDEDDFCSRGEKA